jgi:hypothetical protein
MIYTRYQTGLGLALNFVNALTTAYETNVLVFWLHQPGVS